MNLPRLFAHAVVRRLAYVLVAAALVWLGLGKAHAQVYQCVDGPPWLCDRQQAYEQCMLRGQDQISGNPSMVARRCVIPSAGAYRSEYQETSGIWYRSATPSIFRWDVAAECPGGGVWNPATNQCDVACANRTPIAGRATRNSIPICSNGCAYQVSSETGPVPEASIILGDYVAGSSWVPTGATCGTPNEGEPWDKNKSTCYTFPGATYGECVNPDASHCVTSATGRKYCWKNGEEGSKRSADGTEGADRRKAPTPNTPPDGITDPTTTGTNQGGTTINGNQYNTTTYSGGGGQPGQGDTGVPGDGDGDGKPDEENTSGGGGDCASPPVSSGDAILSQIALQTWQTRCGNDQPAWTKGEGPTVGEPEVGDPAEQTALGIPVSTDFLDQENIFGSASCPSFEIPVPMGDGVISTNEMPFWCTLLAIMRGVILLWGAYTAIRILQGAVI